MKIEAKYMSCCPVCNRNILKGNIVEWEKGDKAKHVECVIVTTEEMIKRFRESHKSGSIKFINKEYIENQGDIYNFEYTKKSGKKKQIQYYQNGDRYHPETPKTLLGVRNTLLY